MKRVFQRLYYFIETLFLRSAFYQLLAIALLLVSLATLSGAIVWAWSPAFEKFWPSVWWAFLRLTDPGYLGDDQGVLARTVSTVLTISGAVIFVGALVAIMTNWLRKMMDRLASGRSRIFEKEHILIIGWHPRIHAIIEEIVRSEERVVLRLGRNHLPAIAILTKDFDPELLPSLRDKLPRDVRDEARLLVRSGNPLEAESLERVDFTRASSIILVSQADQHSERHFSDMTLVKILMSLRAQARASEQESLPNVVLDIAVPANKVLAESVGWQRTEAIASVEFMSRLLCQSVRHPRLSEVYLHLLTDMYGESVFLRRADLLEIEGKTVRETIHNFESAVPIGLLKSIDSPYTKEERLRLMEFDEPLEADDEIICIAPSIASITEGCDPSRTDVIQRRIEGVNVIEELPLHDVATGRRRVLIVGWSHLVRPLLVELASYDKQIFEVALVTERPPDALGSALDPLAARYHNLELSYHQSGLNTLEEVREIEAERFDNIVLLSPEFIQDPLMSDAETVMAFVLIDRYLKQHGAQTDVAFLAELNDEDNQELLELSRPVDILITQEIVSHLLSQVAVRRALAWIYEELFTYGGPEIRFRAFDEVIDLAKSPEVNFDQVQAACMQMGMVALGYQLIASRGSFPKGLTLNPDRAEKVRPREGEMLIVLEPH